MLSGRTPSLIPVLYNVRSSFALPFSDLIIIPLLDTTLPMVVKTVLQSVSLPALRSSPTAARSSLLLAKCAVRNLYTCALALRRFLTAYFSQSSVSSIQASSFKRSFSSTIALAARGRKHCGIDIFETPACTLRTICFSCPAPAETGFCLAPIRPGILTGTERSATA